MFLQNTVRLWLFDQIRPLLLPAPAQPRKKIGFEVKESAGRYGQQGKRK
jgi:hypothetical protein